MSSTSLNMSCHSGRRLSIVHLGFIVLMVSSAVQAANQRFCGKQLVTMLSMLCVEFPDLHGYSKKSMIDFDKTDYSSDEWLSLLNQDQDTIMSTDLMVPNGHMMADQQQQRQQQQQKVPLWMTMMYPQNYAFRTGGAAGANELIPARFRKSSGGIVEECCLKPCGMKELLRYCRVPAY